MGIIVSGDSVLPIVRPSLSQIRRSGTHYRTVSVTRRSAAIVSDSCEDKLISALPLKPRLHQATCCPATCCSSAQHVARCRQHVAWCKRGFSAHSAVEMLHDSALFKSTTDIDITLTTVIAVDAVVIYTENS